MAHVRVEDSGPVRHVVISRPEKRNALSSAVYVELGEAFDEAARTAGVRCVVVRGDGPLFSAGNDVRELADVDTMRRVHPLMIAAVNAVEGMAKPTVAQIHGACIGGAAELALACDLRVMATDAVFGLFEAKLGLVPDLGGCSRLPAIVGLGRAKEIIMTARTVGGEEALRIGLANRVAPADELDAATAGLVGELLVNGPLALGHAKRLLDAAAKPALAATLAAEVAAQDTLLDTEDFREGLRAFAEKRRPAFGGL